MLHYRLTSQAQSVTPTIQYGQIGLMGMNDHNITADQKETIKTVSEGLHSSVNSTGLLWIFSMK
jgi:hypothetical protein